MWLRWISAVAALVVSVPIAWGTDAACLQLGQRAVEIRELRDRDPAVGVAAGESALAGIREQALDCTDAQALIEGAIGSNLHILGRNEEALERFRQGLELAQDNADPAVLAILHRGAGVVLADLEAHDRALAHYLDSMAASERLGDTIEVGKTASNIGNLYNILGDLKTAREYHLQALNRFELLDWQMGIAGSSINLGSVEGKLAERAASDGLEDEARRANQALFDHNARALEIFQALDNRRGIAYASNNLGTALDRLGEPEQAMAYHTTALELRREIGDVFGVIQSLTTMADSGLAMGRLAEAERLLDEAEAEMPEGHLSLALGIAERRVQVAEAAEDFRQALAYQREVTRIRSEMNEEESVRRVQELRVAFDAEQQEKTIELLRSEALVADLRVQRQRLLIQVSVAVGVLLVALIVLLYGRYRLRVLANTELHKVANTDTLTGLANRREVSRQIEAGIERSRQSDEPFALILADIDDFKPINDRLGHKAGDEVLVHLARILTENVRGRDLVARWGGEEFLLFLPSTDLRAAEMVANNLRDAISTQPVDLRGESIVLTLTYGITEYRADDTAEATIAAADQAMYRGKQRGKNQIQT
jgi:diguanylate cyclase (GGDEF)-like protein